VVVAVTAPQVIVPAAAPQDVRAVAAEHLVHVRGLGVRIDARRRVEFGRVAIAVHDVVTVCAVQAVPVVAAQEDVVACGLRHAREREELELAVEGAGRVDRLREERPGRRDVLFVRSVLNTGGDQAEVAQQRILAVVAFHVVVALLAVTLVLTVVALHPVVAERTGLLRRTRDAHVAYDHVERRVVTVGPRSLVAQPQSAAVRRALDRTVVADQYVVFLTAAQDVVRVREVVGRRAAADHAGGVRGGTAPHVVLIFVAEHEVRAVVALHEVVTGVAVHHVAAAILVHLGRALIVGRIDLAVAVVVDPVPAVVLGG
jgi:hypothetical protein